VITDVATTAATTSDAQALPGIHTRLKRRGLLELRDLQSASAPSSSRPTGRPGMSFAIAEGSGAILVIE
jgi:hypothetical protein